MFEKKQSRIWPPNGHTRKYPGYKCSINEGGVNFLARSTRNFEKRFTGGGEICKMVEGRKIFG